MLMIKCSSHIQTSRSIKCFQSCRTSTGLPTAHIDLQRITRQGAALAFRITRFLWLSQRQKEHVERCRLREAYS